MGMDMPLPDTNSDHQTKGVKRMNAPKLDSLEDGVLGKPTKKPLPDTNSDHQTKELKRMRLGRQTASSMLQSSQMAIRQDSFEEEREEDRRGEEFIPLMLTGAKYGATSIFNINTTGAQRAFERSHFNSWEDRSRGWSSGTEEEL